jgi:hypothetical protein
MGDVAEALEVDRRLRLVIDRDIEMVVINRERDRDKVRLPGFADRGQPGHVRHGQQGPGILSAEVHEATMPARDAEHSADPVN